MKCWKGNSFGLTKKKIVFEKIESQIKFCAIDCGARRDAELCRLCYKQVLCYISVYVIYEWYLSENQIGSHLPGGNPKFSKRPEAQILGTTLVLTTYENFWGNRYYILVRMKLKIMKNKHF